MEEGVMLLLIPILGALSAFLFAISLIPVKSPLAERLEALRVAKTLAGPANSTARAFELIFSKERRGQLAQQLVEAGWYTVTPAQMGLRVVGGACLGVALALVALHSLHLPFAVLALLCALLVVGLAYAPIILLNGAIEARKAAVQRALPDFLDMVATTVQAGLSLNAALAYAVDAAPGPLGSEIKEALSEMRLGRSRVDALKAAAFRVNQQEFSTTVTAITQSERMGTNIAAVLSEVAEDTRNHRILLLEERAAKLPVQMTMPMAFFLLPAIFVVIFGAAAANYFASR
ncbi:type II secretion system F family protein [bacterium]|nr:MAG: type II secretion system F family protein [bacterium]